LRGVTLRRSQQEEASMADAGFSVVILAAGKATRFKSDYPKVLHRLAGAPLGEYAVRSALTARPEQAFMVVGHRAAEVRKAFVRRGLAFIEQREQLGTGHALIVARQKLKRAQSPNVVVLVADVPLLRPETIRSLVAAHAKSRAAATVLTALRADPHGYGRIIRKKGSQVKAIVEEKLCTPAQKKIREINSGIICFAREKMLAALDELSKENAQGEYLLTDLVGIFNRRGGKVAAYEANDPREVFGINDRVELAEVEKILRRRKAEELMRDGVTIANPDATQIDAAVQAGRDTILEPGVSLLGQTKLGSGCLVRIGSVLEDTAVGDRVEIRPYSVVSGCKISSDVIIGPFARLREGAVIEQNARIGNFVEVKKSRVGPRTKAWHLTYLGDADLGADVNVGAGTVTCNYDGKNKHATQIEEGVFIGSGSMLVAPVKVGRGSYVAAGSTITESVPSESLAIGRAYQVNKEGWVRQKNQPEQKARRSFDVEIRQAGPVTILDVKGRVTLGAPADELNQIIRSVLSDGRRHLLVNLSQASYLDSAGIGVLASSLTTFRKAEGEFGLVSLPPKLLYLLEAAKLHHVFDIYRDEGAALSDLVKAPVEP
jgi:bifunctional UDP-N-acetylglucosamine pyrophosphorylase / glucosamine-1-phosphate N-acetyltransferase